MVDGYATSPTAEQVEALFDRVAPVYDELNQVLSLGLHRVWKQMAVLWSEAAPGHRCLDVCCGSGDLACLLALQVNVAGNSSGQVYGVDFSQQQLEVARQRVQTKGIKGIEWVQADALTLPFPSEFFHAATMGYGLRNLSSISRGLKELHRVLAPGAKAAILDFHRPASGLLQQFQTWYLDQVVVPAAERLGLKGEYAYLRPSIERFPLGAEQVVQALEAGFTAACHYPIAGGLMGVLVATR